MKKNKSNIKLEIWDVIISNYNYFSNAHWILIRFSNGLNKYINLCIVYYACEVLKCLIRDFRVNRHLH